MSTAIETATGVTIPRISVPTFERVFRKGVPYNLLVAIDNDDNASAAIRITDALVRRGATPRLIRAIGVIPPVAIPGGAEMIYPEMASGPELQEEQAKIIGSIIRSTLGGDREWPVEGQMGDVVSTIAYEAEAENAELLVIGIHHHGKFSQAMGENTATRVMSKLHIPVLGVRSEMRELPRRIMVATDFGSASVAAAHLAANLVDPGGTVILVHVMLTYSLLDETDEGLAFVQREGVARAFEKLSAEINCGRTIKVETVSRGGDPGAQLMAAAEQIRPDMIAIARQRKNLVTRVLLGSVSRQIVRDGKWSMLVTPPLV